MFSLSSLFFSRRLTNLEQSTQKTDKWLSELEEQLNDYSPVDPDDPWNDKQLFKSKVILKKQCKQCGYRLTLPFESNCPLCSFKDKSKFNSQLHLLSASEILQRTKSSDSQKEQKKDSKEEKKEQPKKETQKKNESATDPVSVFNKTHIQVCKVQSVKLHPSADKLYVCEIDIGNSQSRQLCAGLVNSYKPEELNGRLLIAILNLKPKKLKGVDSTAMVLAGDNSVSGLVRVLSPPPNSQVGDRVFLQGSASGPADKQLSGNLWNDIVSQLKVSSSKATFSGKVLTTEKGEVTVDLPDGSGIH